MLSQTEDRSPEHKYSTFYCINCGKKFRVPVRCKNRFGSVCGVSRRARVRSRIEHILHCLDLNKGHSLKFMTLTIPTNDDPREQYLILVASFRRLRQRKWFKKIFVGGASFYEVKRMEDGQYHVHLHVIVESAYIPVKQLSREWSIVSPGKIVDVRMIHSPQVVIYVTKYTLKSDLSLEDQFHASALLKGSRLFQPFGAWHHISRQWERPLFSCEECGNTEWVFVGPHETFMTVLDARCLDLPPPAIPMRPAVDLTVQLDFLRKTW